MNFDKEFWLTVGVGTVGAVVGYAMGRHLRKTINRMERDIAGLKLRCTQLEDGTIERIVRDEKHEALMEMARKKIADTQAAIAQLGKQTEKDQMEQAKWKEMFEKNELTPEEYLEKLSMYLP